MFLPEDHASTTVNNSVRGWRLNYSMIFVSLCILIDHLIVRLFPYWKMYRLCNMSWEAHIPYLLVKAPPPIERYPRLRMALYRVPKSRHPNQFSLQIPFSPPCLIPISRCQLYYSNTVQPQISAASVIPLMMLPSWSF
jgi:hypothetical protein